MPYLLFMSNETAVSYLIGALWRHQHMGLFTIPAAGLLLAARSAAGGADCEEETLPPTSSYESNRSSTVQDDLHDAAFCCDKARAQQCMSPSMHLSPRLLSVCLCVYLSVCLSVRTSTRPSVVLPAVCLFVRPSVGEFT
jgi:hypothetical protein